MSSPFTVRPLSPADLPQMRQMLDLFGRAFDDAAAYAASPPPDGYLARLLGGDAFIAIAALAGGEVVGGLAGYVLANFEQQRSEFYIYDLAVAEAQRRQGVATALIRELQRVAAQRGIGAVFVQADREDEPAIALYTRLGSASDVLHFDIAPPA